MDTTMDEPVEPRWRRRKEARRPEIIAAAIDLFAEKGYAATRLDDVAKRAGVSKGTLYLYFASKDELFKALVGELLIVNVASLEGMIDLYPGPTIDIVDIIIDTIHRLVLKTKVVMLPKLIIAEASNFPELARFYNDEVVQRVMRAVMRIVARGVARGEFRDLPLEAVGPPFMGPILLCAIWNTAFAHVATQPFDTERVMAEHHHTMRRLLLKDRGDES
jgi:AcrR family transcriptional regulator